MPQVSPNSTPRVTVSVPVPTPMPPPPPAPKKPKGSAAAAAPPQAPPAAPPAQPQTMDPSAWGPFGPPPWYKPPEPEFSPRQFVEAHSLILPYAAPPKKQYRPANGQLPFARPVRYARPDFAALVNNIAADPNDALARGVLADFLEEHGHQAVPFLLRKSMEADQPGAHRRTSPIVGPDGDPVGLRRPYQVNVPGHDGSYWFAVGLSHHNTSTPENPLFLGAVGINPEASPDPAVGNMGRGFHATVFPKLTLPETRHVADLLKQEGVAPHYRQDVRYRSKPDLHKWLAGEGFPRRKPKTFARPVTPEPSPDVRGFHAAMHAAPGDMVPHHVYSDYLEEQGHPAKAELIRHALANAQEQAEHEDTSPTPPWAVRTVDQMGAPGWELATFGPTAAGEGVLSLSQRSQADPGKEFWWRARLPYDHASDLARRLLDEGDVHVWGHDEAFGHATPEHYLTQEERHPERFEPPYNLARRGRPARYAHSDDAAFHAAIAANTKDVMPSLVYADYLDEQGVHGGAEVVRRHMHRDQSEGRVIVGPNVGAAPHNYSMSGAPHDPSPGPRLGLVVSRGGGGSIVPSRTDEGYTVWFATPRHSGTPLDHHWWYARGLEPHDAHRLLSENRGDSHADWGLARLEEAHPELAGGPEHFTRPLTRTEKIRRLRGRRIKREVASGRHPDRDTAVRTALALSLPKESK